jgi:pimeloyl-ACP methyl ester carboxylesterase
MVTPEYCSALTRVHGSPSLPTTVTRTAFYLESEGQPLFAWLHRRQTSLHANHGVLLCPPLGHEQVHSHRSWRQLAEALAAAGFPVLRPDYHGTGDSAGMAEDADCYSVWLANLRDAKLWMQKELGCAKVSMIGLRLGASLAMRAAMTEAVENLLLWVPIVSGRRYLREMKALGLTATTPAPSLPEASGYLEAAGFVINGHTADNLDKLDLLTVRPQCRRALIIARDDLPQDRRLLDHLLALGVSAEQTTEPGYADMMAEPHYTKVPREAISRAVQWLLAGGTSENPRAASLSLNTGRCPNAWTAVRQPAGTSGACQEPIQERVFPIRQEPDLFGVLSGPAHASGENLPLILLVNAGSAYRIGPNRLYVLLARQLASQGFRCFRMDIGGLGDSLASGCEGENNPYLATAFHDIEVALRDLEARVRAKRVVLMGLCSGAYFAFQSAVQIANPVLVESVLINPLTFFWKDGMSLEASPDTDIAKFHYYFHAALQPSKWLKLLCGRTKTGIGTALATFVRRWCRPYRADDKKGKPDNARPGNGSASHPLHDDLPADLERVARRGRQLACFFSKSDPGYSILNFRAKRKVRELFRAGKMKVFFCDGADHTFSRCASRLALARAISDYLAQRFQASKTT